MTHTNSIGNDSPRISHIPAEESSTGFLGGIMRFFEVLLSPITWIVDLIAGIGGESEVAKEKAPSLEDRVSIRSQTHFTDRLSDKHRKAAAEIFRYVEENNGVKNFFNDAGFNKLLENTPWEINRAFRNYLSKVAYIMTNASPTYTKGFFAAMAHQISINEMIRDLKESEEVSGGVTTAFSRLPSTTKNAYHLYCNRTSENGLVENRKLLSFLKLIAIPEIETETKLSTNAHDLKKLVAIRNKFKNDKGLAPSWDVLGVLKDGSRSTQIWVDMMNFGEPNKGDENARYLALLNRHINEVRVEVEKEHNAIDSPVMFTTRG